MGDYFNRSLLLTLGERGFVTNQTLDSEYQNENRRSMIILYHGLGNSVIVGVNPNRFGSRRYFIGILGGSNGYEAEVNNREFCAIGQKGTKYFTAKEIKNIDFNDFSSIPNSSPLI